jgi:hypothetical protein
MICSNAARSAQYGTAPIQATPTSPTLSISDHLPLCTDAKARCIETKSAVRAYPVANGDRITLHWSNDSSATYGVIRLGQLYLPLSEATSAPVTPVTLEVELPDSNHTAQVIVDYSGTRHHVPLTPGVWQPLSIYNPDEQIVYVRFDLPLASPPPN